MPLKTQKRNNIIVAKIERHQIITGVGISINLPKGPDVLRQTVAKISNKR